tara:strand:+ start:478 stop:1059 length:582 start_codon:yes stop_codon:yes gene_type:complete
MEKIKIGNKIYTRTKLNNKILKTYALRLPEEENNWYLEAHNFAIRLTEKFDVTIEQAIGVISVLSPRMQWNANKKQAILLIASGNCKSMNVPKEKARKILCETDEKRILEIIKGPKTTNFYLNIRYPARSDRVTVDRHAIAITLGRTATDAELSLSLNQYQFIEKCYIMVANRLNLAPLHLQSITWQTWKRIK